MLPFSSTFPPIILVISYLVFLSCEPFIASVESSVNLPGAIPDKTFGLSVLDFILIDLSLTSDKSFATIFSPSTLYHLFSLALYFNPLTSFSTKK